MTAREQIAEALSTTTTCHGEVWPSEFHYQQADALMPLVDRLRAEAFIEGASGALEAALHEMEDGEDAELLARRADQWRATSIPDLVARRAAALRAGAGL